MNEPDLRYTTIHFIQIVPHCPDLCKVTELNANCL